MNFATISCIVHKAFDAPAIVHLQQLTESPEAAASGDSVSADAEW